MRPGAGGVAVNRDGSERDLAPILQQHARVPRLHYHYKRGWFFTKALELSQHAKGRIRFRAWGTERAASLRGGVASTLAHLHRSILSRIHRLRFTDSRSLFCASRQTSGAKPSISRSFQNFHQPAASAVESWLESAWSQHTGAALCPCRDVRFVRTARLDSPNFCLAGERAR
jgi:hypothetical protein